LNQTLQATARNGKGREQESVILVMDVVTNPLGKRQSWQPTMYKTFGWMSVDLLWATW